MTKNAQLFAPSAARNRDPILAVLKRVLPPRGLVLEIASGSGEHVMHFAAASGPDLIFQPSDPDARARASIDAWAHALGLRNIRPAIALDAASRDWPITAADAVLCINMIHIAPWAAAVGLFEQAASVLKFGSVLYLYGPYRSQGRDTSASNAAFDADLRRQNTSWGVRDLEAVTALAKENGFAPPEMIGMPANNLSLVFRKAA